MTQMEMATGSRVCRLPSGCPFPVPPFYDGLDAFVTPIFLTLPWHCVAGLGGGGRTHPDYSVARLAVVSYGVAWSEQIYEKFRELEGIAKAMDKSLEPPSEGSE
jgi:hypothetical protein